MPELISLSVGIGLVVSLIFSEILGLTAGGMVVPGYIALFLDQPINVLFTLFASYLTFFVVNSLSSTMILFGRRRTVLMILTGFLIGALARSYGPIDLHITRYAGVFDLAIIGFIIPGLIAIWIDRQGLIESFTSLIIASIIVRLALILITKGELSV